MNISGRTKRWLKGTLLFTHLWPSLSPPCGFIVLPSQVQPRTSWGSPCGPQVPFLNGGLGLGCHYFLAVQEALGEQREEPSGATRSPPVMLLWLSVCRRGWCPQSMERCASKSLSCFQSPVAEASQRKPLAAVHESSPIRSWQRCRGRNPVFQMVDHVPLFFPSPGLLPGCPWEQPEHLCQKRSKGKEGWAQNVPSPSKWTISCLCATFIWIHKASQLRQYDSGGQQTNKQ